MSVVATTDQVACDHEGCEERVPVQDATNRNWTRWQFDFSFGGNRPIPIGKVDLCPLHSQGRATGTLVISSHDDVALVRVDLGASY